MTCSLKTSRRALLKRAAAAAVPCFLPSGLLAAADRPGLKGGA
ncbi:MAG: hypothetical protein ACYTG0_16205 [Planctomycetota bacterium]